VNKSSLNSLHELLQNRGGLGSGDFTEQEIRRFLLYYELVLKWNPRLHLTTIIHPEPFLQRHLLESAFAASLLLPSVEQVWDLGTGLGIPGLPIAILRTDLMVSLVEAKRHKAIFLEEVVSSLGLSNVAVVNARIESLDDLPANSCLTARAVEKMESLIPEMIRIGGNCAQMLFLGSEESEQAVRNSATVAFQLKTHPIPRAERRIIFSLNRST